MYASLPPNEVVWYDVLVVVCAVLPNAELAGLAVAAEEENQLSADGVAGYADDTSGEARPSKKKKEAARWTRKKKVIRDRV